MQWCHCRCHRCNNKRTVDDRDLSSELSQWCCMNLGLVRGIRDTVRFTNLATTSTNSTQIFCRVVTNLATFRLKTHIISETHQSTVKTRDAVRCRSIGSTMRACYSGSTMLHVCVATAVWLVVSCCCWTTIMIIVAVVVEVALVAATILQGEFAFESCQVFEGTAHRTIGTPDCWAHSIVQPSFSLVSCQYL